MKSAFVFAGDIRTLDDGADWRVFSACLDNPDLQFPDNEKARTDAAGRTYDNPHVAAAKAVCRSCPVRAKCLDDALARREPWGVWGGKTTPERKAMQRRSYRRPYQPESLLDGVSA